ncbi:MAG: RidA family protein [Defluviitaleaceae bacterium]|nr:RidA family protein [Defluviitaleaceae bacterium]
MSKLIKFSNPTEMSPTFGYSHIAVVRANETIYISGQVAFDQTGNIIGKGDVLTQAEQVFKNIDKALSALELGFDDIVKLTFYLTDISQMKYVREVRDQYININNPPTSSAVEVSRLIHEDLLIEIEAIAVR